jgi:hypothetical protein
VVARKYLLRRWSALCGQWQPPGVRCAAAEGLSARAETKSGAKARICATTFKIKGLWVNCLSRGHGRNVARYGANVRPFTRVPDAKLTRFGAEVAILLRKWCTFAYAGWGSAGPQLGLEMVWLLWFDGLLTLPTRRGL